MNNHFFLKFVFVMIADKIKCLLFTVQTTSKCYQRIWKYNKLTKSEWNWSTNVWTSRHTLSYSVTRTYSLNTKTKSFIYCKACYNFLKYLTEYYTFNKYKSINSYRIYIYSLTLGATSRKNNFLVTKRLFNETMKIIPNFYLMFYFVKSKFYLFKLLRQSQFKNWLVYIFF